MKTLIQLIVVAVVFGGLSATATIFMQPQITPAATTKVAAADGKQDPAGESAHGETGKSDTPDASDDGHLPTNDEKSALNVEENPLSAAEPPRSSHGNLSEKPANKPDHGETLPPDPGDDRAEARVAVRPPYSPDSDEAGGLIAILRERSRSAIETERKLAERQDAMQLIVDDLRSEQARAVKIRQRLSNELKESRQVFDSALRAVETERTTILKNQEDSRKTADEAVRSANEERDKLRKQLEKAKAAASDQSTNDLNGTSGDNSNIAKMAQVYDSMPAETVAKVLEQLMKEKRIPAVVSLMNSMKDRQAAKVLAAIAETNPALAADLTDRLNQLKVPALKPAAE